MRNPRIGCMRGPPNSHSFQPKGDLVLQEHSDFPRAWEAFAPGSLILARSLYPEGLRTSALILQQPDGGLCVEQAGGAGTTPARLWYSEGVQPAGPLHTGLMQGEASLRLGGCGSGLRPALLPVEEACVGLLQARRACRGLGAAGKLMPLWLFRCVVQLTECMAGRRRHSARVQTQ